MKEDTPITLAVATYATREDAVEDYHIVREAKTDGEFDHIAIAVLTKDPLGNLEVERHDSTAKHLAWGGALLGAGLIVAAPVAGAAIVAGGTGIGASVGIGGGASAVAAGAGVGGLAGHFWRNIPKAKIREMGDLLEQGESGLIITAVNKQGNDIEPLLARATKTVIDDTTKADLAGLYDDAVTRATAAEA